MPTLTYIRHAEQTAHNIRDPHIKPFDPKNYSYIFDLIITSPYLRTRETAIILNTQDKPIYVDTKISEYLSPKSRHQIKTLDPSTEVYAPIPDYGESWDQFTKRIDEHFSYVQTFNQNILIVTHGLVVKYLHEKLTGTDIFGRGRNVPYITGFSMEYEIAKNILPIIHPENSNDEKSEGIYFFKAGKYFKLSNFYMKSNKSTLFVMEGKEYRSSEHAYQSYKFNYEDASPDTLEYAELIRNASTANDAFLLGGQKIKGGYQSRMNPVISVYQDKAVRRPDWEEVKLQVMYAVLYYKFTEDISCRTLLLSTDLPLYEDSPYDSFWGLGSDHTGFNHLGRLLMELRIELKKIFVS